MTATLREALAKSLPFPRDEIESALREGLEAAVDVRAAIAGQSANTSTGPIEIDSLSVVELLCAVDDIVGFDVPQKVVRAGGYASVNEAVDHLLDGIEKCWSKRKGKSR